MTNAKIITIDRFVVRRSTESEDQDNQDVIEVTENGAQEQKKSARSWTKRIENFKRDGSSCNFIFYPLK